MTTSPSKAPPAPLPSAKSPRTEYVYKSLSQVGVFTRLLWYSAGADPQILQRCPESDRVKYQGLGGIVLATAALAFFSGSYAFYTVFGPQGADALTQTNVDYYAVGIATAFGIFWSLIIYNVDRFIVSSSGRGDGTDAITPTEAINAIPRLCMAVIIGFCLSAPLELRIMKSEIDTQLALEQTEEKKRHMSAREEDFTKQREEIEQKRTSFKADRERIEEKKLVLKRELDALNSSLIEETQGKTKSGVSGCGPTCRLLQEQIAEKEKKNELAFVRLDEEIKRVAQNLDHLDGEEERVKGDRRKAEEDTLKIARGMDGLLKRIQISHHISGWVGTFITILLMVLEVAPLFFKMMLQTSSYDYLSDNQKYVLLAQYGIEILPPEMPSESEKIKVQPIYHEPKTALSLERARLDKELELNTLAVEQKFNDMKQTIGRDERS